MQRETPIKFDDLLNAYTEYLAGESLTAVCKKYKMTANAFKDRLGRINAVMESNVPTLAIERKLISDVLTNHLKPLKEEIALKSLSILREADNLVENKLKTEGQSVDLKDLVKTADSYSNRLARITGIEEYPQIPQDNTEDRSKRINNFVQNIFINHEENLENKRKIINEDI